MTELKVPNSTSFEANGKTYHIERKLSIDRKIMVDKLMVELGAGFPISEVFTRCKEAYEKANNGRMADAAVILHNIMSGISNWNRNEDTVMKIAALFINETNEDRPFITEEQIAAKITDWRQEGIAHDFFLALVHQLLRPLIEAWRSISASTSTEEQNQKNEP